MDLFSLLFSPLCQSVNPYIVKLSIVDDEPTLDVSMSCIVLGKRFKLPFALLFELPLCHTVIWK